MAKRKKLWQTSGNRKISGFFVFLLLVFVIWTGILLWSGARQYIRSGQIEERLLSLLVEQGGAEAGKLEKAGEEAVFSYWLKKIFSQMGTLSYLLENSSDNKSVQEDMEQLAALFSGQRATEMFWSNVAAKKARELVLFEKSDTIILALNGEEEAMDTPDEEENIPVQSILLFKSGSPDITYQNQEEISGKNLSQALVDSEEKLKQNLSMIEQLNKTKSRSYLLRKFYITDSSTSIDNKIFQVEKLLSMDLRVKKESSPQILIFHTHGASESFIDSRKGKKEDSIIGIGEELAQILSEQYGYQVLHDKTEYDRVNGKIDRNKAYNNAYRGLQKTLEEYPSIQIIIDLHRDGVGKKVKRTTTVAGKRTAQVMFFNGLSRNAKGDIAYLHNDNLQANLAFSLQLKIECMKRFENFAKPVYLKSYRYNMHLKKRYTLIELGNENNTVEEAKNAMPPLAMVIDAVLTGK